MAMALMVPPLVLQCREMILETGVHELTRPGVPRDGTDKIIIHSLRELMTIGYLVPTRQSIFLRDGPAGDPPSPAATEERDQWIAEKPTDRGLVVTNTTTVLRTMTRIMAG